MVETDTDILPQVAHATKMRKQDREAKRNNVVTAKWYELRGEKVSEVVRKKNGSVCRKFLDHRSKCGPLLEKAKRENTLKVV